MTPLEYIEVHPLKPLTPKEIKKGKGSIKISGTEDPMPWEEIYDRLRLGEPVVNIAKEFGHIRKIILFAIRDKIVLNEVLQKALFNMVDNRKDMKEIARTDPHVAMTIQETANKYAPNLAEKLVRLGASSMDAMQELVNQGECTTNDHKNMAVASLTWSDLVGLTQRHANAASLNVLKPVVEAFDFVEDYQEAEVVPSES